MAGHGYTKLDPAIERWNKLKENSYKHFRITSRTGWQSFAGLVLFPGFIYWLSANQDMKWQWSGKLKGQSLARVQPTEE